MHVERRLAGKGVDNCAEGARVAVSAEDETGGMLSNKDKQDRAKELMDEGQGRCARTGSAPDVEVSTRSPSILGS